MLHASVRINAHFLIWPRSWFALIPLRILVQIHYSSEMCRNYTHKQILWVNSCSHVYFHIVMKVPKATPAEDLMNSADKSGWRPERGKSISHLSWIQEHCAAWDDLLWSTDPIFQEEFLRWWRHAGPVGLASRLKNRATRIMLCTRYSLWVERRTRTTRRTRQIDTCVWRITLNSAIYK